MARYSISPWLLLKTLPRVFGEAWSECISDNAPRLSASVAFYTLLSLAPVIVIAVALAAAVYGQEAAEGRLALEIQDVAGPEVARTIQEIIKGAYRPQTGVIATSLGLVILMFGASSVFVELHEALNTIWHIALPVDRTRSAKVIRLIRVRFDSFATVLGTGALLLVSLVCSAWIASMRISVPRAATFFAQFLVVTLVFAALYKIVPNARLQWSDVVPGAAITAFLFMVGKEFMGLYFAHTSFGSTYSAAGSPIVVLLWVYYSAQLFFWGAEFSKVYQRTVSSKAG